MHKNKKEYLFKTTCMQFLICSVFFAAVYTANYFDSNIYYSLNKQYFNRIDNNLNFIDKANKPNLSPHKIVENTINKENKPTLTKPQETYPKPKTKVRTITDTVDAKINAEGGNDTEIKNRNEIPSNVSCNSYILNKRMILPVKGTVTSKFGERVHPISGKLCFHAGIDIAANQGTPIKAAFDGKVIKAEYDQWNGNHIKLQHANKIMTVYCHCCKLNVKVGDSVKAGDIIGYIGSTGSSTGPHLHFEFRINDISYDPQIALENAVDEV